MHQACTASDYIWPDARSRFNATTLPKQDVLCTGSWGPKSASSSASQSAAVSDDTGLLGKAQSHRTTGESSDAIPEQGEPAG